MLAKLLFVAAIICTIYNIESNACSCQKRHPQQHFCDSDFVILAKVARRVEKNDTITYKVRIRQEYKMTEKALVALKSGKIHTALYEEMCGASNLDLKKTYVISGRIISLRAYISFCDMIKPREEITKRQKKGLKLMYKNGCSCSVVNCLSGRCARYKDSCNMMGACHEKEGICLRNKHNACMWRTTKNMRKCIREDPKTYHFPMVGVEGLFDKRKAVLPQSPLYLEHVTKHPRLVLDKNT